MRLYQREAGGPWWVDFWHAKRRVRKSAGTTDREAAQQWADELKASLWRQDRLGERVAPTWDDAVLDWLSRNQRLRSLADRKDQLRWASKHLAGRRIDTIDKAVLAELARKLAAEPKASDGKLRSDSTVNRYLAAVSAILGDAVEQGHLTAKPRTPARQEPDSDFRWATKAQALRLIAALPPHLAALVRFSLATGLRQANVTQLEWSRVDIDRAVAWIESKRAKGKRAITVPLNDDAIKVLRGQKRKHARWVFPYRGKPLDNPAQEAWKRAVRKAKLPAGFRWHDLRHTWASWHVQNGTPLPVLQELGGWRSLAMVMRYAHLAPGHLAQYAGAVSLVRNQSQGPKAKRPRRAASS